MLASCVSCWKWKLEGMCWNCFGKGLPHSLWWSCCRYKIMREYMPKRGALGTDMMFRSCTVQVGGRVGW